WECHRSLRQVVPSDPHRHGGHMGRGCRRPFQERSSADPMSATALFIGVTYGTDELAVKFARSVIALQPAVRVVLLLLDNTERTGRESLETALRTLPGEVLYLRAPG